VNYALRFIVMGFCLILCTGARALTGQAQEQKGDQATVLTNKDVVEMLKTGLPPDIVAAKVKSSKCNFDTSVAALNDLRAAKVPDSVILAMVEAPRSVPFVDDGHIRVYVTDSQSWETYGYAWFHGSGSSSGGTGSFNQNGGAVSRGGARPQTVEIIKTFGERCPDITVTNQPEKANYVVTLDHEGGKGVLRHRNKVALFNRNGDVLFSHSTLTLGNSVKDACEAIHNDTKNRPKSGPK
jgi:hypothetical protein